MAEVTMCEPYELYNLLNQGGAVSRLADVNFLFLIDARELKEHNISHIITAKIMKKGSEGKFLLPVTVEVDTMQHVVVYDSKTSCLEDQGRATECAQVLATVSLCPVRIVRGGFEKFSALYPFLRTEKYMYTIMELENLKIHPLEIIAGLLYIGDLRQGLDPGILRNLKISAIISISESDSLQSTRSMKKIKAVLNIPVADLVHSDLYSNLETICSFIGSHITTNSRVLVVSRHGRSRCSAVIIAFIMYHLKYTLEEAWRYLLKCKPNMRPNTGFVQQLSNWELHTMGAQVTDITEPHF